MKKIGTYHIPALLKETIENLKVRKGGKYIDATLGGGGHSSEIVAHGGNLLAIDQDIDAIKYAGERLENVYRETNDQSVNPPKIVYGNFANIDKIAKENDFTKVDGILFDLGVSSHQLEEPSRGFSFNQEGPLDMRMDLNLEVKAEQLINGLNQGELSELFLKLGEEKFAKRIAVAICRAREIKPIKTCDELAEIILKTVPGRGKSDRTHPATRVFQALRIAVNDELNSLREALPKAVELLDSKARLIVLSFHSLEDGIIKRFFLEKEMTGLFEIVTDKPVIPTMEESKINPRARSAKLRSLEKK